MKIGLSSYSLYKAIKSGEMDYLDAISWTAENGGEHFELVPLGLNLAEDETLLNAIKARVADAGIVLSSYTIGANFVADTDEAFEAEIKRVCCEVDVAAALGVTRMRHDVGSRPAAEATVENFEADFPRFVHACRVVADHAKPFGIVTSVENHGYHVQSSERVKRLVLAVNRENFRTTVDVGNFIFADEDPLAAVRSNLPLASMVHFKDFYRRSREFVGGEGWWRSRAGYALRGSIVGDGDLAIEAIAKEVRSSGFDGFVSLEFEGFEDCRLGSRIGLKNLRRLLCE